MPKNQDDFIADSVTALLDRLPDCKRDFGNRLPSIYLNGVLDNLGDAATISADNLASRRIETADGPIWIQGHVVMCQCPDCSAPVSIRLWLMIADCWSCQTSIELSYEQQFAARQLAEQFAEQQVASSATAPREDRVESARTALPVADQIASVRLNDSNLNSRLRLVQILRKSLSTMPAWLISTLVHLMLLLILALILLPKSDVLDSITLSTAVSPDDLVGGVQFDAVPDDPLEFDTPLPPNWRKIENQLEDVRIRADQDARELIIDPDPITAPPNIDKVVEAVTTRDGPVFSTRDPRLRNELVRREGGTTLTEAAVSRGLRWLASVQNRDGSWSLSKYWNYKDPRNRGDAAATSLALLPFLGAGQTHEYGRYKETVSRGLKWLMDHQKADGDLRFGIASEAGMYAHGQAAIVLVESLAMTGDERFRDPAQRAIDFVHRAQHKNGGWRYRPGSSGDTSVLGWQLMALQSARGSRTGLVVDEDSLKLADYFLDMVSRPYRLRKWRNVPTGSLYRYLPADGAPRATMTAEALLCRMYLGWRRDDPRMMYGVRWLLKNALPDEDELNLYYYYYATQVMHHYGGQEWELWNRHLRDLLVVKQLRGGKYPGSWNPRNFEHGGSGGRIYVTAMAVCTLEVYYRHLPLFKQLDLD